jgi:hypothetical protein
MAPTRPATGGRPRNAWTSSRHRKLVRLHTLTTLSKDEIRMVLSSNEFSPWYVLLGSLYLCYLFFFLLPYSVRDIGKKFAALFPRDYVKTHHKYHPSKNNPSTKALMIQRFERLRKHRTGKPMASGQNSRTRSRTDASENTSSTSQDPFIFFGGSISAFRNYGGSRHTHAYEDSSESQLVKPSSLLLDGSTVNARPTMAFDREVSTAPLVTGLEYQNRSNSSAPLLNAELVTSKPSSPRSSIPSLRALEQRLSCRSMSIIRHVHSVLRYSSTSSWASASSWRSSWLSFGSSVKALAPTEPTSLTDDGTTSPTTVNTAISKSHMSSLGRGCTNDPSLRIRKKPPVYLRLAEQCVWHELVDENQLAIWSSRPVFYPTSLTARRCFHYHNHKRSLNMFLRQEMCGVCGFLPAHIFAAKPQTPDTLKHLVRQINVGDYFNNRSLHFAAAALISSADIIRILEGGGDPKSINTYGATFVHVLFEHVSLKHLLPRYLSLLEYLVSINFDFSCRDYHGRTPWHMLFQGIMDSGENLGKNELVNLGEAIGLLEPDLDSVDNFGFSIRSYVLRKTNKDIPRTRITELLPSFRAPEGNVVNFQTMLSEAGANQQIYIEKILVHHRVSCVDKNGDTALIALVKGWKNDSDDVLMVDAIQNMVARGAEVNMRDRVGNTALAIATQRGLRPAVTTLVDLGASIHSRNYQKVGILSQAHNCLAQAKDVEADELYSMVLSCIVFLADLGATTGTHGYREWGASCVPLKDLDKACSSYRKIRLAPADLYGRSSHYFPPLEDDWLL